MQVGLKAQHEESDRPWAISAQARASPARHPGPPPETVNSLPEVCSQELITRSVQAKTE